MSSINALGRRRSCRINSNRQSLHESTESQCLPSTSTRNRCLVSTTAPPIVEKSPEHTHIREIVLDTETTGLSPKSGHRIIEIGCVELLNHKPTGNTYQQYINPQRRVPSIATSIHGITNEFLVDKPLMKDIIHDFLSFIGDSMLIIHNANFDMRFLNAELQRLKMTPLHMDRVLCTLKLARQKFPAPNTLDALCKRYHVNTQMRVKHGALLDSFLLVDVYQGLLGVRESGPNPKQRTRVKKKKTLQGSKKVRGARSKKRVKQKKTTKRPGTKFRVSRDRANKTEELKGRVQVEYSDV